MSEATFGAAPRVLPHRPVHREPHAAAVEGVGTSIARRAATFLAAGVLSLLQACGGGTSGDPDDPPPAFETRQLTGRVETGFALAPQELVQVRVKGSAGLDRMSAASPSDATGADYAVSLTQLEGPYLLNSGFLYSAVAEPATTANLTPFTTLLVVELLGVDPASFFEVGEGKGRGGFSGVTPAEIDAAEVRTRRFIERDLGFEIPPGVGAFVTAPFEPVAGDPMFDAVAAFNAQFGEEGSFQPLIVGRIGEIARCKLASVSITAGSNVDLFCPIAKSNEVDEVDTTINVIGFSTQRSDALTVRTRGNDVLSAQYRTKEGASFECSGAGCNGITLGTPAGDLTRPVSFAAATLTGAGGSVSLQGSLQTSEPGIALPGLPCTTNRYFLIHPDRSVEGYCATPDGNELGAAGFSTPSGATRRVYTFGEETGVGPTVEVVTQGDAVLRVLVQTIDPATGETTSLFQCRDGCPGVTAGPSGSVSQFGVEFVLRTFTFDGAVLPAVLPDGTLSTTDSVTLEASLTGAVANDPGVLPYTPVACPPAAPTVTAIPSDQPQPVNVCAPDDTQGFSVLGTFLDEFGNTVFFLQNLLEDGAGSLQPGNSINVVVSGGTVVRVSFDQFNGPRYQCEGSACAGVTLSAPNAAGETVVSLSGTVLQELGTANLPADRTATLNGSFVAPPAPPPPDFGRGACSPGALNVDAILSDQTAPIELCTPDDFMDFALTSTTVRGDGNTEYFVANLRTLDGFPFDAGDNVKVLVDGGGAVLSVSLRTFNPFGGPGPFYRCEGAACTGVTVMAPNAAGETSIVFSNTVLQEIGPGGVPAQRTATLSGSFLAPAAIPQ